MVSDIVQSLPAEQTRRSVRHPIIQQRIWMLGIWGSGMLILASALVLYSLSNGWFWALLFGLGWLLNIVIVVGLIFWVLRRGDSNENSHSVATPQPNL